MAKPKPDSTGLIREYQQGDGGQIHLKLDRQILPLSPKFVQGLSPAPGGLIYSNLHVKLLDALEIPEETYKPAQNFVRDYGKNLVEGWGSCLLLVGHSDPLARRILAAGVVNEILRVYHNRADVSAAWLAPRSFESLYLGYNKEKMDGLYGQFTKAKIAVFDGLNAAMKDSRASVEEVLMDRITHKMPSILVMNAESPTFSDDLADELMNPHHYVVKFQKLST